MSHKILVQNVDPCRWEIENNWEKEAMDEKKTFLNGKFEMTIYIDILKGVAISVKKQQGRHNRPLAYWLIKSIYGLKQSPYA